MLLKIKNVGFDTGRDNFCYINKNSQIVSEEGLQATSRVMVNKIGAELVLVNDDFIERDEIGLSDFLFGKVDRENGSLVEVSLISQLKSFDAIIKKRSGEKINRNEMVDIVNDISKNYYSKAQIAAFCSLFEGDNISYNEISYLTEAMVISGDRLTWNYDIVVDKHCIGGVPGNRTTNIVVPIVAEYGLHIPKTSSRAITSPSGTTDTMEALCNVNFKTSRIKKIVNEVNGCIIWGGSVRLSPTDDLIINVRKSIKIDTEKIMIASILSKKISAGSTHVLIVIPIGPNVKAKNIEDFKRLRALFECIGRDLGIHVVCEYEDGAQPVGNGIGPVLEAIDILSVLENKKDAPHDLRDISLNFAGKIIEFDKKVKVGDGIKVATEILESGRAYSRFMKIIDVQGGLKKLATANIKHNIVADSDGIITSMNN
ncbi:MAG: thymidine phosphorylase, partial [Rickettsiales bacterium]|nr:thymidine phosphorylase [Rickettsiales bacterium]